MNLFNLGVLLTPMIACFFASGDKGPCMSG